ncbi:Uncharacterized protein dnm_056940 [Desulfonema magnum]|uniref:Uncharacterized protein n=1 Tax=Desulfonema magnum TaxID=45655 RepID=A0A975GR43_9BACT|nr:Uncharacterized protein dnm_056940 [Desulfonema magnum]
MIFFPWNRLFFPFFRGVVLFIPVNKKSFCRLSGSVSF